MNPILAKMNTNFGIMLGRMEHAKLKIYAKNANKVQEILLKKLMKKNILREQEIWTLIYLLKQ